MTTTTAVLRVAEGGEVTGRGGRVRVAVLRLRARRRRRADADRLHRAQLGAGTPRGRIEVAGVDVAAAAAMSSGRVAGLFR